MTNSSFSEFDIKALFEALDAQRESRSLTWAQVTRDINDLFKDVHCRPISTSTLTGMRKRGGLAGNGVLQMLIWLDRTPESFVAGHPQAGAPEAKLPHVGPARILRWDTETLYQAIESLRIKREMSWQDVANEIGVGWTPSTLKALRNRENAVFPSIMWVTRWLGQPVASFTHATEW